MRSDIVREEELMEPTCWCRRCGSLAIKREEGMRVEGWDGSWCTKCGGTDIVEGTFGEWLECYGKCRG